MTDGNYQVEFTTDAKGDFRDLDGGSRKRVAAAIKNKLTVAPQSYGHPLGSRSGGDLTGLRKLVVGNRDLRIIYEVADDDRVVILWVIGNRSDDECYSLAYARVPDIGSPSHRRFIQELLDKLRGPGRSRG